MALTPITLLTFASRKEIVMDEYVEHGDRNRKKAERNSERSILNI
jgi:hypothetical protein